MTKNEEGGGDGVKTVRNRECCHCGGDQLKRNFPQLVGEKNKDGKSGKDASGQWCIRQSGGKRTEGAADEKDSQLHAMFTSCQT